MSILIFLQKVGLVFLTMLFVSILVFCTLEINIENVAIKVLGQFSTPEQRHLYLEENGYYRPVYIRYAEWIVKILQGDFGYSTLYKTEIKPLLIERLLNTLLLMLLSLSIIVPVSLTLGVLSGMKEGSWLDTIISFFCILTTSIPEFASAIFLTTIFVLQLKLLPGASIMIDGFEFSQIILPVTVLSLFTIGYIARMTRSSMIEVMENVYIKAAFLKGLPYKIVILKHALRNALITPITVIMLQIPWLLSGLVVVESFFAYKGFGLLLLDAALNDDIYLIEACTLVSVFFVVTTQILADLFYKYLNPKIKK